MPPSSPVPISAAGDGTAVRRPPRRAGRRPRRRQAPARSAHHCSPAPILGCTRSIQVQGHRTTLGAVTAMPARRTPNCTLSGSFRTRSPRCITRSRSTAFATLARYRSTGASTPLIRPWVSSSSCGRRSRKRSGRCCRTMPATPESPPASRRCGSATAIRWGVRWNLASRVVRAVRRRAPLGRRAAGNCLREGRLTLVEFSEQVVSPRKTAESAGGGPCAAAGCRRPQGR